MSVVEPEAASDGNAPSAPVRVVKTVGAPVADVWQALVSPSGAEALLGPGAAFGGKGEPWHSDDGPSGVLRSYHPQEQLRWSWHETPESPASVVELDLVPDAEGTRLDLRHDGVTETAAYEARWNDALDRLDGTLR